MLIASLEKATNGSSFLLSVPGQGRGYRVGDL